MSLVEDPLYDSNGKPWSEQNIFKKDQNLERLTAAVFRPLVTETSDLLVHVTSVQKPVEEFLVPSVIDNASLSCTADLKIMSTKMAVLYDKESFTSKDFDFSDEDLLNQEFKVFTLDALPDLPISIGAIKSFVDLNNKVYIDTESQCFASSPFIGLPTPPIVRNDIINEFCHDLEQNLALSSDQLQAVFVLSSQKRDDLIQDLMEKDLHYDQKRLREPIFHKDTPTDPILEALQYLDLPLAKDRCLIMQDASLKTLTEDLHEDLRNPLFQVSTLKHELDQKSSFFIEEHIYLEGMKEDSHQYENLIQDSSLGSEMRSESQMCFDEKANSFHIGNNPLDTFMLCRTKTIQTKINEEETLPVNDEIEESDLSINGSPEDQSDHKNGQENASQIIKIPFTGPYMDVMKCIMDYVSPHFDKAKQYGRIPHNQSLLDISVDKIRFLYKESEQLYSEDKAPITSKDLNELQKNLLQSYAMLLHGRITLDLLVHACLESAVTHLSSCIDSDDKNVGGYLVYLHDNLFKTQMKFMESNCNHPKFTSLTNELNILRGDAHKVLVLVPNGLLSLQHALQRMFSRITSIPIHVIHSKDGSEESSAKQGVSILLERNEMDKKTLEQYSFVIQYSAVNPKIKFVCDSMGISYIGFISEVSQKSCCIPSGSISKASVSAPLTVISSNEVMQYKNLVYLLEARYNIMIVERNYLAMKQVSSIHYADLILSLHHCIVFLAIHEMCDQWDLETFITRMVAVGFQCSYCYIIVHGIGASNRYLLDNNVLLNLYKLRASLSNLSRSSTAFTTTYKVLMSSNEDEMAFHIRAIADQTLSQQEGNSTTFTIKTDMSKEEIFLLQFACFNSYSAQRFLSLWSVDEVFKLDPLTIKSNIPNISHDFLAIFEVLMSKKKETDCISISSESPAALSSTSSKSLSSVISTDKGSVTSEFIVISEDDNYSLIPTKHSENHVCENRHDQPLPLDSKRTQVYVEGHQAPPMLLKNKSVDQHEQDHIKNMKCAPFFPGSPDLLPKEIVSQHDFEIKQQRKRSAISNAADGHLKIPRMKSGIADLPSKFQTMSKRNTSDKHLSMAKENSDMQYLYERDRINERDFCVETKPHESNIFIKSYRERQEQRDCFIPCICTDYCHMEQGNSMKYPLFEESEKNIFISNECLQSSQMIYGIDTDEDFFDKKILQYENSENFETAPERTVMLDYNINRDSHSPKPEVGFYKSDLPTSLSRQNAQETKHSNTYGIFSDKIYRTYYKNDKVKDAKEILSHSSKLDSEAQRTGKQTFCQNLKLDSEDKRTGTLTTSSHYFCTENENKVKRDNNPVTYPQPRMYSSKLNSTGGNSYSLNDISFPVTALTNHRKYVNDNINYFHFKDGCSRFEFKSGTDFCCGNSSCATSISPRMHKNQSKSNLQQSTFPSFSEKNLKSEDRIDNHIASYPLDLHLKMKANTQRQNKKMKFFEKDLFFQQSPEILKSVENDSEHLHKYCHLKHFKKYAYSPKHEKPSLWNRPDRNRDVAEDRSHFSLEFENFDLGRPATLFEHQIRNVHQTSFVPSPPMDFMDDVLRNVTE